MSAPPAKRDGRPADILVVDDMPTNLQLLSGMLGDHGYHARLAPNGKLALLNAQAFPPDLILLDVKMPGMNGYEVCERLKADPRTRDVPVIFLSALDQTEDKVKAFTVGGVDYVTKPFQVAEVLARVETHLALHRLQSQLRAANAELEASNADLDAFAHTVAHDLKSPLTAVIGYGELLQSMSDQLSPQEAAHSLERLVDISYKMRDIIEALLLLAGVRQAGQVARDPVNMGVVVDDVLARLAPDVEAAGAEIVKPESWPVVRSYAPWIKEIWANYVSNALKYGGDAERGVTPHVVLGVDDAEDQAGYRFFVRDNGLGLTPEEQAQVFGPFTRFHQDQAQGHGLGLSIVQRIAEKLGGRVGVESAGKGQGCTFWFVLPPPRPPTATRRDG